MEKHTSDIVDKKWTLIELLKSYSVEIPKIQRDYAQGRNSPKIKKIRHKFLASIYQALERDDSEMNLEFIYGSVDGTNTLFPLDGQQRLTTLFLLHWFGCVVGVRDSKELNYLRKFSYTTRHDAEMFCQLLTSELSFEAISKEYSSEKDNVCISDIIKNQPGFLSVYRSDPTAAGMMVMLNAIQNKFQNNDLDRLKHLENINFYFLPLEKFELTDELYIKMNHRGKPLTEFEILKAQIAECLQEQIRKEILGLFDRKYTDFFWTVYQKVFDDEILRFLRFAFFIDYYRTYYPTQRSLLQSYTQTTNPVPEGKEKDLAASPANSQEEKDVCFYDLFKESEQNAAQGRKDDDEILTNSDRLDNYILSCYQNGKHESAQDILTTFTSHPVEEDFFKSHNNSKKSEYVELFLPPNVTDSRLFVRACSFDPNPRNNPFPYAEQIFMFALYLYYKNHLAPETFLKRFRTLRNLVRNSEYVREESLTEWLTVAENVITKGSIPDDCGSKICSAEMYDYERGKSNLSEDEQDLLAEAENHPAIHGFAIGFIARENNSYRVNSELLRYFLTITDVKDKVAQKERLKLLRKALLLCDDFSALHSKDDVQEVRFLPHTEEIGDWRYFTIPTSQREKTHFFDALEYLRTHAREDLATWVENRINVIPKNERYYFVKYADYIFPFGKGYYCLGKENRANVLLLNSRLCGNDNLRWNMHLAIINQIWSNNSDKDFFQGNKNAPLSLPKHSTVTLHSCDDCFRLDSLDRNDLATVLKDASGIQVDGSEIGHYYFDLKIPQINGVDAVDRIEYLRDNLDL